MPNISDRKIRRPTNRDSTAENCQLRVAQPSSLLPANYPPAGALCATLAATQNGEGGRGFPLGAATQTKPRFSRPLQRCDVCANLATNAFVVARVLVRVPFFYNPFVSACVCVCFFFVPFFTIIHWPITRKLGRTAHTKKNTHT